MPAVTAVAAQRRRPRGAARDPLGDGADQHRQRDACRARAVCSKNRPRSTPARSTDKGSLNQRAVLARRAATVEEAHRAARPIASSCSRRREDRSHERLGTSGSRHGGASGLGAQTARALRAQGAHVTVLDRDGERAAEVAREVGGFFARCDVN